MSFPSGGKRTKQILELVHSDVFGPVKVPSLGKSVYYVSFIDDFSRNTWIYFLKKKSEVFDRFKEFKALVENQTEKKISQTLSMPCVKMSLCMCTCMCMCMCMCMYVCMCVCVFCACACVSVHRRAQFLSRTHTRVRRARVGV